MKTEMNGDFKISPFGDHTFDHFALDGCFTELLEFQQDFSHYSLFALPPSTPPPVTLPPSEAVNLPATPNESSISSLSTDAPNESDPANPAVTEPAGDVDGDLGSDKKEWKKKKGGKRQIKPRFAFLTKSEVDHLEDGYRWRKYGQKAVKNSPYPRSYYRCTTATCGVKKRVERSSEDPTVVVTTYEGQHTHTSPMVTRGMHLMCPRQTVVPEGLGVPPVKVKELSLPFLNSNLNSYLTQPQLQSLDFRHVDSCDRGYYNPTAGILVRDQGLLQDLIPSDIWKVED